MLWVIFAVLMFAALVGWFVWGRHWFRQAREYMKKCRTCGYLPPPPTPFAVWLMQKICRIVVFAHVGKMIIKGQENLDKVKGQPVIATPNHLHWADVAVLPLVINGPARYMAAQGVMEFAHGVGGLIVCPFGAFAANLEKGKGGPAREAAIEVLVSGQTLGMFPEGWAYLDGRMGPLKKGAVRICKEAARRLGKEAFIVPMFFRYGTYPGSWIRKLPPWLEYVWMIVRKWNYRRGVTVIIGEPISASSLPDNDDEATELLRNRIVALDPAGKNGEP